MSWSWITHLSVRLSFTNTIVPLKLPLEGARFELRYLSGETSGTGGTVIGQYVTSSNGSFTVTGLREGTYICQELESPDGHLIDSEAADRLYLRQGAGCGHPAVRQRPAGVSALLRRSRMMRSTHRSLM